jgi:tetratricopeptide (TPR) repeat protein
MAERADADIRSANQVAAVRRLSRERENLHAALAIMTEMEPQEGASFVSSMQSYWAAHGYSDTQRLMWLTKALTTGGLPPALRARLLNGLARCEVRLGRPEAAVELGREAVEMARASQALDVLSIALGGLGHSLSVVGDLDGAREAFEESATIATERGSTHSLSVALGSLGEVTRVSGELDAAITYYEKALDVAGRQNRSNPIGIILANLGGVSLEQENYEAAANYYRKSLAVLAELENLLWASTALDGIAAVALHEGDAEKAALLAGAAEGLSVARGFRLEAWEQSLRDRYVARLREILDPETLDRQWNRGRAMTLPEACAAALAQ